MAENAPPGLPARPVQTFITAQEADRALDALCETFVRSQAGAAPAAPPVVAFLGLGYSARAIAAPLQRAGIATIGTSRTPEGCARLEAAGHHAIQFTGEGKPAAPLPASITHIVTSISPAAPPPVGPLSGAAPAEYGEGGYVMARPDPETLAHAHDVSWDPSLRHLLPELRALPNLKGVVYLSSVGAFGDHQGAWVNECATPRTPQRRGRERVLAEIDWLTFGALCGVPVQIHRLSGIYGPGRGPGAKLRSGRARRLIKPGHVFNRIHANDIAQAALRAFTLFAEPNDLADLMPQIVNITDDEPAPPQDVLTLAANLMDLPLPPEVPFVPQELPAMTRSFYAECKRVSNAHSKQLLGMNYFYPTYREGIPAVLAAESGG